MGHNFNKTLYSECEPRLPMRNPNVATTVERLESEAKVVMVEKTVADRTMNNEMAA